MQVNNREPQREVLSKECLVKIYREAASTGISVELQCHLVLESLEIDLAAEGNFEVFAEDDDFRPVDSDEDAEYLATLIQSNFKKAIDRLSGMNFEGYLFLTFRRGTKENTIVFLPDIQKIHMLPEELEILEMLTSIILESSNVDSRYNETISRTLYLQLIQQGRKK